MKTQQVLDRDCLEQLLKEFLPQRGEDLKLRSLGYFGSYARGEARADSDIDIVFETDHPNLLTTSELHQDLVELLGRPVDVVRYRERMNPRFKSRLEKESVYV